MQGFQEKFYTMLAEFSLVNFQLKKVLKKNVLIISITKYFVACKKKKKVKIKENFNYLYF